IPQNPYQSQNQDDSDKLDISQAEDKEAELQIQPVWMPVDFVKDCDTNKSEEEKEFSVVAEKILATYVGVSEPLSLQIVDWQRLKYLYERNRNVLINLF